MARTTLTLEPDVQRMVEEAVRRERTSFKEVVNGAIRRGLGGTPRRRGERYTLVPHETELQPGFDPARLNQLVDELEVEEMRAKVRRKR
jgi:hypothetical protein